MPRKQMRPLAEVYFGVRLTRKPLTLELDSANTFYRSSDMKEAGEWEHGPASKYSRALMREYPAEQKRAAAVAAAFARLLEGLNEDLRDCSCVPGDMCPAHGLLSALKGKAIK